MKNVTTHTGTLNVLKRLPSSRNGNLTDSSEGYSVNNHNGKTVTAQIGTHRGTRSIQHIKRI